MAGGMRPRVLNREAIREMYAQDGQTGVSVAQHFGCSKTMIYEICADIKKVYVREQDWSEADVAKLRELWGTMPCKQLAYELGRGKNAVVGKAHRLGLANLGNPVKGRPKNPNSEQRPVPRRIRLASITKAPVNRVSAEPFLPGMEACTAPNEKPKLVAKVSPETASPVVSGTFGEPRVRLVDFRESLCRWIEGPARGSETQCCGNTAEPGSLWCKEHRKRATKRVEMEAAA